MEELQVLEAKLTKAHQQLEDATNFVERLEGRKDYVLQEQDKIKEGYPELRPGSPKEQQMILFDDVNCNKIFSDGQVQEIKNCLAIILGNAQLVLRSENLAEEDRERLKQIEKQVWRIDGILSKKEKDNES